MKNKRIIHSKTFSNMEKVEFSLIKKDRINYDFVWFNNSETIGERDGICSWWTKKPIAFESLSSMQIYYNNPANFVRRSSSTFKDDLSNGVKIDFKY